MAENYSITTDVNAGNSLAVLDQIIAKVVQVESAIGKASGQKLQIDTGGSNTVLGGLASQLSNDKGKFANVGREIGQSFQMGMQQQFGMAGGVASSLASAMGPIGIAAGVTGAALIGLGAASTQAAMKWEDMKTSIGRTTGLKGDNLEDMMSQLQSLRMEFGVTAEAASSMVEQAGSIGVGQKKMEAGNLAGYKQEILDFTKATAMLQGAWGMSAEATSSGIGKMGSVTLGQWNIQRKARGEEEMSWADYAYKVGGTVDNLANAMGSSEEEIVTAMRNSSGAVAKWAPSEETYGKWQAMASFLIDTGDSAGEAGTKIERVSQKMEQNSADIAAAMGIDKSVLETKLKTDFMGTIQEFGTTLAAMPTSKRPDLFKMFGLEGASLMGKVIADVEAGTGKLQSAFKLALDPGNVKAGYEDVADNASKAFDRIGQALQVSLERVGGQLLPIVTDVANGIADAWIAANDAGTDLFTGMQKNVKSADALLNSGGSFVEYATTLMGGQVSEQNIKRIEEYEKRKVEREAKAKADAEAVAKAEAAREQVEYEKTTQYSIGEKAVSGASFAGASFKDVGVKSGIEYVDALNTQLNTALPSAFTDNYLKLYGVADKAAGELGGSAGDKFGEGFLQAMKDNKVSSQIGALIYDSTGKIRSEFAGEEGEKYALGVINSQSDPRAKTRTINTMDTFFGTYSIQKYIANAGSDMERGIISVLDGNGAVIASKAFKDSRFNDAVSESLKAGNIQKELEDQIKPAFVDMPKFMKSVKNDMKDSLSEILNDGVVDFTEKDTLGEYIRKLDDLRVRSPVEFDAKGLDKIRDDLVKTAAGIPITFNKEELETNFALWQRDNMDMYQKIYDTLSPKYGKFAPQAVPTETEERKLHDALVSADDERLSFLYDQIDKALTSGDFTDAEVLPEVLAEIATIEPKILNMKSTTQRLEAIQELYGKQVISTGDNFRVLDTNGQLLSSSHLRTSVAAELASVGLLSVRDNAYAAASALSSILGVQFSGPKSNWDTYNWVKSREYDSEKNNAFPGTYQGAFNIGTNKSLNFGSVASIADFGGLLSTFNIPKLGQVSKVSARPGGTLAFVGEGGEDEFVIPVSAIKGLYPESTNIAKGSFNYLSNYRYFEDYAAPEIRAPTSYRWAHYPDAPNVDEINTQGIQTAWLADNQLNSRDIYSGLIRQMQLASIGKSQVIPWFARGMQDQPDWWVEAATKLSPQYASNWAAQKGGVVPQIVDDIASVSKGNVKPNPLLTGSTAWATIYDNNETCIGFLPPDQSANIHLTPRAVSFDAEAFAGVYDNSGTCIAFVKPDKNLNFKPGPGYEVGGSRVVGSITSTEVSKTLDSIDRNTAKSADKLDESTKYSSQLLSSVKEPIKGFDPGNSMKRLTVSSMPGDALVTGLSREGYLATYDPRTDTCEGLSFVAPDPSLKTTDKFYLGLSQNSPFYSSDKAPGYGWENTAQPISESDRQLMKIAEQSYKEQQQTQKDTTKIEQNTREMATNLGTVSNTSGAGSGFLGSLVTFMGGFASGAMNSRGSFGGQYGSLFGDWYGGGAAGLSAHLGTASSASWMNAAATSIGGSGAIQWAEGGFTDSPVFGVFGEAGREAFVPISDRAAGRRILPQVMRELGVRMFSAGGFVGSGPIDMSSIVGPSIGQITVINNANEPVDEEKLAKKILAHVAKKDVLARKRRG